MFPLLGRLDFCCRPATERTKQSSFEFDEVELFVRLCRIISLDSSLISAIFNQFLAIFYIRDSINSFLVLFLFFITYWFSLKYKEKGKQWEVRILHDWYIMARRKHVKVARWKNQYVLLYWSGTPWARVTNNVKKPQSQICESCRNIWYKIFVNKTETFQSHIRFWGLLLFK